MFGNTLPPSLCVLSIDHAAFCVYIKKWGCFKAGYEAYVCLFVIFLINPRHDNGIMVLRSAGLMLIKDIKVGDRVVKTLGPTKVLPQCSVLLHISGYVIVVRYGKPGYGNSNHSHSQCIRYQSLGRNFYHHCTVYSISTQ